MRYIDQLIQRSQPTRILRFKDGIELAWRRPRCLSRLAAICEVDRELFVKTPSGLRYALFVPAEVSLCEARD